MIEVVGCNLKRYQAPTITSPVTSLHRSKVVAESSTGGRKPDPERQGLRRGWRFTFHQSNDSNQANTGESSGSDLSQSSVLNPVKHLCTVMTMSVLRWNIRKKTGSQGLSWNTDWFLKFYSNMRLQHNKKRHWDHRSVFHHLCQCRWYEQADSYRCSVWKLRSTEVMCSRCWIRMLTQIRDQNLLEKGWTGCLNWLPAQAERLTTRHKEWLMTQLGWHAAFHWPSLCSLL